MRSILLVPVLFFVLNSHAQNPRQASLLRQAYQTKSDSLLRKFLNNWAKESRTVSAANTNKKENDTLRNLYEVYNAFYKKDRTSFSRYLLLPDRISYHVIDSLPQTGQVDSFYYAEPNLSALNDSIYKYYDQFITLQPFYPRLQLLRSKTLLLTESYKKLIEQFLDTTLVSSSYYAEEKTTERAHSDFKINFLGAYLDVVGRHWGHFYDYMSFPEIDLVLFDRSLTHAVISYDLSCKGGAAYMEKQNGKWSIVEERILISQ